MPIGTRNLKTHFSGGRTVINGWCSMPTSITPEILARLGYDTVTVDLQHGLLDYQMALSMLQAIDLQGVPALCRVPWNEPGIIMKVLDAGFVGVICPMVNTRTEAEAFVSACRYAPRGSRSFGPTRALQVHGADYARTAQDFVCTYAMIETAEALANLDDILGCEELDGVYIGPSDLALSLGYTPSLLPTDSTVIEAIETIRSKTKGAGKIAGIHCGSPKMTRDALEGGFDLATLLTDVRMFTTFATSQLAEARQVQPTAAIAQY